jgi:hypothetical protein
LESNEIGCGQDWNNQHALAEAERRVWREAAEAVRKEKYGHAYVVCDQQVFCATVNEDLEQLARNLEHQAAARAEEGNMKTPGDKIHDALDLISQYGGIDGGHHKQWVLDQVVRILAPDYASWVREQKAGEVGPESYEWDEGIAP